MSLRTRPLARTGYSPATLALLLLLGCSSVATGDARDPLPSWRDGESKQAIVDFVERVTTPASADFVPTDERVATFDNDGTLWSEKPLYFQLLFAMDRVRALAPEHPEWSTTQPFQAVLEGDMQALAAGGIDGLMQIVMATHAGMTTTEFEATARDWIEQARHPTRARPFTDLVYQPMLELLDYLRTHGFDVYIVSGGGIEFMRAWTEGVYGVPPSHVIGSRIRTRLEQRDGEPVLVRLPELAFVDDKADKPVAIYERVGRRPIAAFGNSDGDLQMLQWTVAGDGARFALLVHHTDAVREWAYDRNSKIGHLSEALDEARERGWIVVDMAAEWNVIYPFELEAR